MKVLIVLMLILVLGIIACSEPKERRTSKTVSRADYGAEWPLTIQKAELYCYEDAVWIEADGKKYAVNGWAESLMSGNFGYQFAELRSIWRDNPENRRLKISIGVLIDDGMDLCDE